MDTPLLFSLTCLGLLCGASWGQQTTSSCQDLDTQSCEGFHRAKPDLCTDPKFSDLLCKRFCGHCPLECYNCPVATRNPSDCTNTTTCDSSMQCVTRHLRAADGHHEYIMKCESKEICSLMVAGFGKRDMMDPEESRYERDVVLDCCDTDFCNFPATTTTSTTTTTTTTTTPTTTTTTTTTTPKPTSPPTVACYRDVVFVVQDSGLDYHQKWLDFVSSIVSHMNIGPHDAHVAMVTYTSHADVKWQLDQNFSKTELLDAISKIHLHYNHSLHLATHNRDTTDAIRRVRHILDGSNGDRPGAENAVVFLMDVPSNDYSHTLHDASNLHRVAKDVVTIVQGNRYSAAEAYAIATDSHHVFHADTDDDLINIVSQVLSIICA